MSFKDKLENNFDNWLEKKSLVKRHAKKSQTFNLDKDINYAAHISYLNFRRSKDKNYSGYDPYNYESDHLINYFAKNYSKALMSNTFTALQVKGLSIKDKNIIQRSFNNILANKQYERLSTAADFYRHFIVGTLVVLVLIPIVILVYKNSPNNYAPAESTPAKSQNYSATNQSNTNIVPYISSKDGFSIQFPNTPSVTPSTDDFGYSSAAYNSTIASSGAVYWVMVDNFPNPPQSYINGELQGFEQNNTPVDVQKTTFEGYPAVSGEFYNTQNQDDAYAIFFYTSSQEYFIEGQMMSQSTFNNFANSFQLSN